MKREIEANELRKTKKTYRFLAIFLCILMAFSICGIVPFSWAKPSDSTETEDTVPEETQEDIKASLLNRITYEGWDPYSSDMTLEEFYALMELFEDGSLPLRSKKAANSPSAPPIMGAPGIDEPGIEEPGTGASPSANEEIYVPRTLFLMSGFAKYEGPDAPGPYDNINGSGPDYPAGLGDHGAEYYLPPEDWSGVPATKTNNTEAFVIVPKINDGNNAIAGDVDQSLFPGYNGYYVRRVAVEGAEISILGAIKLPGSEEYVYYYLTSDTQSTDVSTTMLPEGQRFIIQYQVREHVVDYQLYMDNIDSEAELPGGVTLDSVFGADRPDKTDDGKYAFTATAPYGYELELRVLKEGDDAEDKILLGFDSRGEYTDVNEGWALGKEPDYKTGSHENGNVTPNTASAPSSVTMSSTIYNNEVHHDRTVVGILHPKNKPVFLFAPLYLGSTNVAGRGATIKSDEIYSWENDFSTGGTEYPNRDGGFPNLPNTLLDGGWDWNGSSYKTGSKTMKEDSDGTYSYTFLFQTNSSDDYVLDALAINGFSITIPFYPKESYNNTNYKKATGVGISQWLTETTLPDGVFVKVEHLLVFGNAQHHYRITVSGAHNNVTISGMNLMQYKSGAPEFSAYYLNGINAPDPANDQMIAGVEFFKRSTDRSPGEGWRTAKQASITVDCLDWNGDPAYYGANFRFKLADGYGNPYFLWESTQSGAIAEQGSGKRDELTGEITEWNSLESYPPQGAMDTTRIYGPDEEGYYYFSVTTQEKYQIALLTIVARPVRYVMRYVPSYASVGVNKPASEDNTVGIIDEPDNMPEFVHDNEKCHQSFHWDNVNHINGWEYDDKYGDYYDTAIDTVVILPTSIPEDPDKKYVFVDWVLVDDNFAPVKDDSGNEYHYRSSNIVLADINQYSIPNEELGGNETDIYVLRLMPTWREIINPFNYKVALNWVDAQGNVNEKYFDEFWRDVITDWDINNGGLTVKVLKDAEPFLDWIAQNPTYTFWDGVNNNNALYRYYEEHPDDDPNDEQVRDAAYKAMRSEMEKAIREYLPSFVVDDKIVDQERYDEVLNALCSRDITGKGATAHEGNGSDDFWRLGEYAYQVLEDEGTIVVWMYENKGGLVFHKDVDAEPFVADDEFYFTVDNVRVKNEAVETELELNGEYKAYPQQAYDEFGKPRPTLDKDAWLVTFKNGAIISIVKNDGSPAPDPPVTHFTLKDDEGIMLYVPAGEYTIVELGSKSGGSYKVDVTYTAMDGSMNPEDSWYIPNDENLWLRGSEKQYFKNEDERPAEVSQVYATVSFDIGEQNVVQTLTFRNQTSALSVEVFVRGKDGVTIPSDYLTMEYTFNVAMNLPEGYTPLEDENGNYYFNMVIYNADGTKVRDTIITMKHVDQDTEGLPEDMTWFGQIKLKDGQRAAIVMNVPDQKKMINYWAGEVENWENTATSKLTPQYITTQSGTVKSAECAEVGVINWYGNVPPNGYLVITEKDGDPNESFLYKITDPNGNEMIVSVNGGGQTVVCVPLEVYTIEEISDWSWKYEDGVCDQSKDTPKGKKAAVGISSYNDTPENAVHADYNHTRNDKVWLGGENNKNNNFGSPSTSDEEQESNSSKQEVALLSIFDDKKKKHSDNDKLI